ncbi:MAG TPA: hypothetical protein VK175_03350 [Leadbetterella sp.]|nr:hypothetical protein [Leadbetterella sp.]
MKKTFISFIISLLFAQAFAQNAKVIDSPTGTVISNAGGNDIPYSASILDIRSSNRGVLLPRMSTGSRDAIGSPQAGLLLFNSTTNQFNYHDGVAWQQAFFGNQWSVNGVKYYYNGGNVGIGVSDPLYKLDLSGSFHTTSNGYIDGSVSIGGNAISPSYKLQVNDGSLATFNTVDNKFWAFTYSSASNYLHLNENGTSRVYFQNGGNVGIGVNPSYRLDVDGTIHASTNLRADGNAYITGTLSVNNGNGIVRSDNATQRAIAYAITPANLNITLSPGELSGPFTFAFGETFTSAPAIAWGPMTGMTNPGNIIMVVESIGLSTADVRFKNVGSTTSVATNATVSAMIIGNK